MRTVKLSLALLAATCLATPLAAAPADAPNPIFTGRDLFDLSAAADPQISPDGRTVAYVRRSADIMSDKARSSIWLINVATGEQRPLAAGAGDHFSPRWSPDGRRLAYVSTAEGGAPQMFVRWMDTGQTVRVTGLPDSPQALAWSPDGHRIAYLMNVPDDSPKLGSAPAKPDGANWAKPLQVIDKVTYRADGAGYLKPGFDKIFMVDADGGAPRQLSFGTYFDGAPEWTADGRAILFSADRSPNWELSSRESEIYRLDVATGAITALTNRKGPDGNPKVSPDGRTIAFLGFDDTPKAYEQTHVYVMPVSGGAPRQVAASLDRNIDDIAWVGNSLVGEYEEGGSVTIARIGLDGSVRPITHDVGGGGYDRPYASGGFSVAKTGAVAFTVSPVDRPADVAISTGGGTRQLTRLNDLNLGAKRLATVRSLDVRASDGANVPSWLMLPPTYQPGQRVPMILEIHGGPYSSYGPHFSTDYQLYAASGYAVLFTNPRGSTGYGQAFADGIDKTYPEQRLQRPDGAVDGAVAERRRGSQQSVRHRRLGRRHPHRLDRRQDRPLQGSRGAKAGDQLDQHGVDRRRRALLRPLLDGARCRGRITNPTGRVPRSAWSPTSRPRPWSWSAAKTIAPPTAKRSNSMPRSSSRGVPTTFVKVPDVGHGGNCVAAEPVGRQGIGDYRLVRPVSLQGDTACLDQGFPRDSAVTSRTLATFCRTGLFRAGRVSRT